MASVDLARGGGVFRPRISLDTRNPMPYPGFSTPAAGIPTPLMGPKRHQEPPALSYDLHPAWGTPGGGWTSGGRVTSKFGFVSMLVWTASRASARMSSCISEVCQHKMTSGFPRAAQPRGRHAAAAGVGAESNPRHYLHHGVAIHLPHLHVAIFRHCNATRLIQADSVGRSAFAGVTTLQRSARIAR